MNGQNFSDPLSRLRGIHTPDPVSFWPPAPGWWFLAILVVALLFFGIRWGYRRFKAGSYARAALKELSRIQAEFEQKQDHFALCKELSILLKRTALVKFPQRETASLFGEEWLYFLDETGRTEGFTRGVGKVLENVYRSSLPPEDRVHTEHLFKLVKEWIKK